MPLRPARSPKESRGVWLCAKTAERESRRSNSSGRSAQHKETPNGPVTMMSPSLLNRNHNRNRNHNWNVILLSNPRTLSFTAHHEGSCDPPPGIPIEKDGKNSIFLPTTSNLLPSLEPLRKTRKTNSTLYLRRARPPETGATETCVQYHAFQAGRMTPRTGKNAGFQFCRKRRTLAFSLRAISLGGDVTVACPSRWVPVAVGFSSDSTYAKDRDTWPVLFL